MRRVSVLVLSLASSLVVTCSPSELTPPLAGLTSDDSPDAADDTSSTTTPPPPDDTSSTTEPPDDPPEDGDEKSDGDSTGSDDDDDDDDDDDSDPEISLVRWAWSGALGTTSIRISTGIDGHALPVRVRIATSPSLADGQWSTTLVSNRDAGNVLQFEIGGLTPDTRYYYAIEADGVLDRDRAGTFRTLASGAFDYRFTLSGDAVAGADTPVFDAMRLESPTFGMSAGDLFYANIDEDDVDEFRDMYERMFGAARQAKFYRSAPFVYMWDDHDFGPNDSSGDSPSRPAARRSYQEIVPHYPLADAATNHLDCLHPDPRACQSIAQSFALGRTLFIATDLRSERTPKGDLDDANKTMLGSWQKTWFKNKLAAAADRYAIVFWICSVPWIAAPNEGSDHWGGFATERREIANFMHARGIDNVILLSGDAHMLALDDGTNSAYADGATRGPPVFHAAALARSGSVKGGPYSHGAFPSPDETVGQYAVIDVADPGAGTVCVHYRGKRMTGSGTSTETLIDWAKCYAAPRTADLTPN